MSIEPNATYGNGVTAHVVLGGRSYPVPPLAIKQLRRVVPAVMKVIPSFVGLSALQAGGASWDAMASQLAHIDQTTIDALTDMVYWSLTRAHPSLTRDEFDNMEVTLKELVEAIPVVVDATGLMEKKAPGDGAAEPAAGEAAGGSPSTGTA